MGLFIQDIGNSDLDKGMPMAGTRDNYLKSTMLGGTFISPAPPFIDFTQGGWNTIGNHFKGRQPHDGEWSRFLIWEHTKFYQRLLWIVEFITRSN